MSKKVKTNTDFVIDLMEQSNWGALTQVFILHAIEMFAKQVSEKELSDLKAQMDGGLISADAWHGIATELTEKIVARSASQKDEATPAKRLVIKKEEKPELASAMMRDNAPPGTNVKFTNIGGREEERAVAASVFDTEKVYTVSRTEPGSFSTDVYLAEYPNRPFNAVMFRELTKEEEIQLNDYELLSPYAAPDTKVKFMNANGLESDRISALEVLTTYKTYTVQSIQVSGWVSHVTLAEFPSRRFNTVMFSVVADGETVK